jgi:hypothetical protein
LAAAAVVGTEAEQEAAGLAVVTEASGLVGGSEADPEVKDLAVGKAAAG